MATLSELLPGPEATDEDWAAYESALFTAPSVELRRVGLARVIGMGDYREARARLVRSLSGPKHPDLSIEYGLERKGETIFVVEGLSACECHPFRFPIVDESPFAFLV